VFQNPTLKLEIYGSLSTGLALDSSDFDLCISGLDTKSDKDEERRLLGEVLYPEFEKLTFLTKIDSILDTDFPVLKIQVHYAKLREEFWITEKVNPEDILHLDITVLDKEHFGIESKNFVSQMISMYPDLKSVCLVLKKIVKEYDLNEPYTGGIGSYSMFLLLLYVHFNFRRMYPYANCPSTSYAGRLLIEFLNEMKDFDFSNFIIGVEGG